LLSVASTFQDAAAIAGAGVFLLINGPPIESFRWTGLRFASACQASVILCQRGCGSVFNCPSPDAAFSIDNNEKLVKCQFEVYFHFGSIEAA
jgi:hypothetical protein